MAEKGSCLQRVTRAKFDLCPVFGTAAPFNRNVLPTYEDIMKQYLYTRQEIKMGGQAKEPTVTEVSAIIITDLEEIWKRASLPTISKERIMERLREYHAKYRKLLKPYKQRQGVATYMSQIEAFRKSAKNIFDIAACKCKTFDNCSCEKSRKVPLKEREFLTDQRSNRTMMMGGVDFTATKQLQERQKRKLRQEELVKGYVQNAEESKSKSSNRSTAHVFPQQALGKQNSKLLLSETRNRLEVEVNSEIILEDTPSVSPSPSTSICTTSTQMRRRLPTLARECDRWGLSDRGAAAISTAVLQDMGIVTEHDASSVIDRSKLRRERQKFRKQLQVNQKPAIVLQAIYFDGRKDKTRKTITKNGVPHPIIVTEEHVVLVKEPDSEYLGHITPPTGTALDITNSIIEFLDSNNFTKEELLAVGCDGTNVNTGFEGGIIRKLEVHCNKPLHWFVCLLHMNELPLRHLLINLDGITFGPNSFSGPIGKAIRNCVLPITKYRRIEGNPIPEVNISELSSDQKYLYKISSAVMSGECSQELADLQPGPMSHSRWLTTASRILRLYVSSNNPSENLLVLATYVVRVYVPLWFAIKTNPGCYDGPRHLWKMIQFSRYLPQNLKNIVDVVIQRNAFFAHPENMLLAMLTDGDNVIRELAFRRVLKAKVQQTATEGIGVRQFRVPKINFDAQKYYEMIDYESYINALPPLIRSLTCEEIESYINDNEKLLPLAKFPCHTQSVERCIRLVTEASAAVGESERDGYIRSRIKSRSIMHHFNKKADYNLQ